MDLAFGIVPKKSLLNSGSQGFSPRSFSFRVYIFRSVICCQLIFVCGMSSLPPCMWMCCSSSPFVENTLLLHCTAFVPSWESCIPVCVGFSLGHMSVLNLFCLFWCHCCSVWMVLAFIVHLKVVAKSPALFWLFQMLGISMWILESTFWFFRRSYWYFYWDYIKSINQFGEYWHFNSIGFSNSWT